MTRARLGGLLLLLLSGVISILWGYVLEPQIPGGMIDFKGVYYGGRCLLQHGDPYIEGAPLRAYLAEGDHPHPKEGLRQNLTWYIYLPTTFILIAPIALMPWGAAHLLWMILTGVSLIFAALLMWNLAGNHSPGVSLFLISFVLANSEILLATGNPAGIAVGLCLVAVWCFLRERFVLAGVLCLAVSLAIKPHDAGLIWLYFLLAGRVYRKRALQTLVMTVVLGMVATLWVSHIAPHWMGELNSNLLTVSSHGRNSDPGPANPVYGSGPSMIIDIQSTISAFRDDPRIYNPVTYLICGMLLLVWSVRTLRSRFSQRRAWLALAAVSALTMLVTYHRSYDAKLLLLTIPACAMLWAEGGLVRWLALLVNAAGIVFTSDIPLVILMMLFKKQHISTAVLSGKILAAALMRPTPLILLAMGIFYLCVYLRPDPDCVVSAEHGEPRKTPLAPTKA